MIKVDRNGNNQFLVRLTVGGGVSLSSGSLSQLFGSDSEIVEDKDEHHDGDGGKSSITWRVTANDGDQLRFVLQWSVFEPVEPKWAYGAKIELLESDETAYLPPVERSSNPKVLTCKIGAEIPHYGAEMEMIRVD